MKKFIMNSMIFAAGAAIGSTVTWKLLRTKYEQIANEEIESVKEMYRKKDEVSDEDSLYPSEIVTDLTEKRPLSEYAKLLEDEGYSEKKEESEEVELPYVISPDDFGDLDGYSTVTLYCYEDGVIVDEEDELVDNADTIIGKNIVDHFGEFEDDSVFVRNDARRCDYEILKVASNYVED